jgi:hypothetical protein
MPPTDYTTHTHSEDRRAELGHDRLFLRPPSPTAETLDELKDVLQTNRSLAAAYAIHRALKELAGMTKAQLQAAIEFARTLEDARIGE